VCRWKTTGTMCDCCRLSAHEADATPGGGPARLALALLLAVVSCFPSLATSPRRTYDWASIQVSDTLALFVKKQRVGRLYHRIVVDSLRGCVRVTKDVVAGKGVPAPGGQAGAMTVRETQEYDFGGRLLNITQSLESASLPATPFMPGPCRSRRAGRRARALWIGLTRT
jgi:hypothetical protein